MSAASSLKPGCDISIRPAIGDDVPFVMREWLRSYKDSEWARHIDRATYFRCHRVFAEALFARGAIVAALPGSPDVLAGFLVGAGEALHYVYVKPNFRRFGVASAMLEHVFSSRQLEYSHYTTDGRALLARRVARYNPYL